MFYWERAKLILILKRNSTKSLKPRIANTYFLSIWVTLKRKYFYTLVDINVYLVLFLGVKEIHICVTTADIQIPLAQSWS